MSATTPGALMVLAVASIAVLVLLVTWRKMNAFLALFIAALLVGLGAGMAPLAVLKTFQEGLGATMGGIAAVIALGAMVGKLLEESGAARVLAEKFSAFFGPQRAEWCIVALAIAVGLVTWFAVGLLLLLPVLISLARETKRPFLLLAIPLLAFLSVMHGLMPPHPGPVVAVEALGADTGRVLGLGFLLGLPVAALAGPLFARWVVRRVPVPTPELPTTAETRRGTPSFGATLGVMSLPIGLMLLATGADLLLPAGHGGRTTLNVIGHPVFALIIAFLVAAVVFQRACRFTRKELLTFTEQSIAGIGLTLLVVGAGGGFARVLREAGVAAALGNIAGHLQLPPLIYGWLLAAFIRVATGSATVAITTAAGLLVPLLAQDVTINRELLVLSVGCGSLFLSHLNDGGFWIVKESLGLTVGQTLRTWTVVETLIGILGLGGVLLLDVLFKL